MIAAVKPPTSPEPPESDRYDVVIAGGALSGAATAILLLRRNPGIRLLIIEKSERFSRRVGEATVEISAYFLGRVLGLTQYLNECHLIKQGLRYWWANDRVNGLDEASEAGAKYLARIPSYQVDRATLDEEVLRRAVAAGADLLRPASVQSIALHAGGDQVIAVRQGESERTIRARWVVDASGVAALLARRNGWWKSNTEHPTAALWSRWKGVKDWDSRELAEKYPDWSRVCYSIRNTATNHVIGDGWWSWWIPLKGGDVSVGVVFDQRLVKFPQDGRPGDRLKAFLMEHPVGREMLADAQYDPDDVHWRKNLAYYSTTFAGDGFVLVGDAAAFMDPFYSPGMDWISFTASGAADLITRHRSGRAGAGCIGRYNRDFRVCHRRWFNAVYKDKYEYMGEFDLMSLAFCLDLNLYYLGVVDVPFRTGDSGLYTPPFSPPSGRVYGWFMSLYNRRFAAIARRRRRLGRLGRTNRGRRLLIPGYRLRRTDLLSLVPLLARWAWIEVREGWRSWGDPPPKAEAESAAAVSAPAQAASAAAPPAPGRAPAVP